MEKPSTSQKVLAWSVHAFTASGIIFAFLAILAVQAQEYVQVFVYLAITFFIDGIDGTFARAAKVQEVLPNFSGDSIDHVIDFTTYAIIPAYFLYESNLLPENLAFFGICVVLLTSCYYYGKSTYVTHDLHFEGFPVLWNFVAFYLFFIFDFAPMTNFISILIIGVLHFVPWKYPYPSRTKELRLPTFLIFGITGIASLYALFLYPEKPFWVEIVGYISVTYLFGVAIYKTYFWRGWEDSPS
ncbi:MAG: hypothetical protein AAGG68_12715 [Bacteroidota bacterium]